MTLPEEHPSDEVAGSAAVLARFELMMKSKRVPLTIIGATISRKAKPPSDSWWAVPASQFISAHQRELPRILRNHASVMPPREGDPVRY